MRRHRLMSIMLGAVLTIGSIHMPVAAVENVNTADTSSQGLQQEMAETEEEQDREEPDETASEPIVSKEDASESITSEEESDVAGTEEEIAADEEEADEDENSEQYATSNDLAEEDLAEETPNEEGKDESITAVDLNDTQAGDIETEDSTILATSVAAEETETEKGADPANGIVVSGKCGDNVTLTLNDAGTLTISGTGAMRYYVSYDHSQVKKIIIQDGVTAIQSTAFESCENLTSVSIPSSVTSIGYKAFAYCYNLKSIVIPSGVTSIGNMAFWYCTSLTNVTISSSVTELGESAFAHCENLKNIVIPSGVTSIGEGAFEYCDSLTKVTISTGVSTIEASAFADCDNLTSVSIPSSVTTIGKEAFLNCDSLKNIDIPSSVTSVGDEAFFLCKSLVSAKIGNGVETIGELAFGYCSSLTNLTLSSSLKGIDYGTFCSCTSLKKVIIPASVTYIEEDAFLQCSNLTDVTIGENVEHIGMSAFSACGLTSIVIPSNVKNIEMYAFGFCHSLGNIEFKGDAPEMGVHIFCEVKADAIYPKNNKTWTKDVMQDYGGTINWGYQKRIAKATIKGLKNKTYTGREIKQTPKVVFGGKTLKVGTDYTLSYKNNIRIGTATIIIKGKGDYTGSLTKTFKITKISISKAKITGLKDKAYTGKAIEQMPTVTLNNKTLAKTAYTVTFSNNVKVGTATVIVKGKGNYGGTAKATFKIGYSISKASVTNIKGKTFTKTVQNSGAKQSPIVKIGNTKLKPNTDYILTYKGNKETGTASVVIKGNGKYVGSVTKTFKISLSKPSITLKSVNDGEVNCTAGTAFGATGYQFEYYKAGTSAKKSSYGSSINRVLTGLTPSATYYVRVRAYRKTGGKTFFSDYSAYKKIKVFKATKNIAKAKLSFTSPNTLWVYNGSRIKPEVVVKDGIITLRNGVDYKLDYANNTNAGTAKVIISGRGKYYGSLSKSFAIGQAGISGAVVTVIDSGLTYTSLKIEPKVTVVLSSKPLIKGKDFKVYYENNTNAGTGKVVIKGTGNYTGSCSGSFKIKSLSIDKCEVTLPNGNRYVKSDDPLEPPVVVSYKGNTIPFEPNINYELSYHIDEEEGRGKVTVSGVKNITGSKELDFDVITGFIWPTKSMRVSTLFYYSGNFERPYASHGVGNPIDIPGTIGDDIYAVQDGVVTDASYGAYGNHIYIKLEDGSQLIYGHLSKFDVKTNDKVTAGQKIGELGNTGNSTGPHLHFAWTGGNAWSEYYKQLHLTYDDSVRDANTKHYGEDSRSTEVIDWFKAHYYKNGVFQGTWVQ